MKKTILFTGLVAAAAASANVSAGFDPGVTVSVAFGGIVSPMGFAELRYDSSLSADAANSSTLRTAAGGPLHVTLNGTLAVKGFCLELNESFQFGQSPFDYTVAELTNMPEHSPPGNMKAAQAALIEDLYSRHWSGEVQSDEVASFAFQLLIWEISHENLTDNTTTALSELDMTKGAFAVSNFFRDNATTASLVQAEINTMIGSLGSGGFNTFDQLIGLTNPDNQDMLVVVPTPAIAGLAGLGLAGMRRRRR